MSSRFATIRAVILDGSCVPAVDVSGCQALVEMIEAYRAARVGLHFAAFPQSAFQTIDRYVETVGIKKPAPPALQSQSVQATSQQQQLQQQQQQSLSVMPVSGSPLPGSSPSNGSLTSVPPQQVYVSPSTGMRNYLNVSAALAAIGVPVSSPMSCE